MDKLSNRMALTGLLDLTEPALAAFIAEVAALEQQLDAKESELQSMIAQRDEARAAQLAAETAQRDTEAEARRQVEQHNLARQAAEEAQAVAERRREIMEAQLMNPITLRGGIPMQNDEGTDGELVYRESAVRESMRLSGYPVEGPLTATVDHEWADLPAQSLRKWGVFMAGVDAPLAGPLYSESDADAEASTLRARYGSPVYVKEMS